MYSRQWRDLCANNMGLVGSVQVRAVAWRGMTACTGLQNNRWFHCITVLCYPPADACKYLDMRRG